MNTLDRPGLATSLEAGYTLPADWYTDGTIFEQEKRRIFRACWQYVGLKETVATHGDFLTCSLGEVPVLFVRDGEGLRAFANVCRHRGAQLVHAERGNRKSIQCHYHAWTYGLDGRLRAAPGSADEPGFDPCEFSLVPIRLETWGPFIFVNPDPRAPGLFDVLGELPRMVEDTGIDLAALRWRHRDTYDIRANWKVVVDNYLECYHCPVAHPGFSSLMDLNDYTIREYGYFSTQTAPMTASGRAGKAGAYTVGEGVENGFYAFLWPNFMLNIYPGPGNVSLNLIQPAGVDRTSALYEYCFADAVGEEEVEEFVAFVDQVQREDVVLCESVQQGLQSGFFDQGRLLVSRERALRHFQMLVYRHLEPAIES